MPPIVVNCQSRFSKVMPSVAEPVKESVPQMKFPEESVSTVLQF